MPNQGRKDDVAAAAEEAGESGGAAQQTDEATQAAAVAQTIATTLVLGQGTKRKPEEANLKQEIVHKSLSGEQLCRDFNTDKCKNIDGQCHNGRHRCNYKNKLGAACFGSHSRSEAHASKKRR